MTENKKPIRKFEPGDSVWIMENNTPQQKLIFAVVESLNTMPWDGNNIIHYHLVDERMGTGWGNNEGDRRSEQYLYASKEELVDSL